MAYKASELAPLLRLGAWNFDPAQGSIVTDFQSGHGYTTSGADASSNVNDSSAFVAGSQCATVVSGGTGASAILQNTSTSTFDTTSLQVAVVLMCPDTTHLNSVNFSMGNSNGFSNEYHVTFTSQVLLSSGAWQVVTLSLGDAVTQGSPTRTGINAIRVYFKDDNTGNKVTVHWQAIWFMPNAATQKGVPFPSGVASLCFDDGYATQWATAKPYLDASGLRASAYIIKDQLSSSGRMTLAQLQALQDQSGWEINSHAYTDADHTAQFTGITAAQLTWDLSAQKEWLRVNSLDGQGFAYPKGGANPAVVSAVREWYRYSRGTQALTETWPPGDPYRLKSFSSISEFSGGTAPSSVSGAGGKIDKAVSNGAWLILTFHNIIPAVTSVTMSGNIATIVFAGSLPTVSNWQATAPITLAGFTPSGLNGTFTIASVVSSTTITVNIGSNPGNGTVMGTATTATTDCSYPGFTAIVDKLVSSGIRVLPVAEAFAGGQLTSPAPSFPLTAASLPSATTAAKGIIQLDGTAGDIALPGAQAAGANGKAADAAHVHPDMYGAWSQMGTCLGWSSPPFLNSTSNTPTIGALVMQRLLIPVAATITNFNMLVNTAGNTLANVFGALVDLSGNIVASTANRAADAALTTSGALWTAPFQSTYAAAAGYYYGAVLIGTGTTTAPAFRGPTTPSSAFVNFGTTAGAVNLRVGTFSSSLSALPGSVTMGSVGVSATGCWVGLT